MIWLGVSFLLNLVASLLDSTAAVDPSCECIYFNGYGHLSNGTFLSPGFPNGYEADIWCLLYTFAGANAEIVELTFNNIELGNNRDSSGKCLDYIRLFQDIEGEGVNEESRWQQELCGNPATPEAPLVFYSKGSMLVLEFHSDSLRDESHDIGFEGEFRFLSRRDYQTTGKKQSKCLYRIRSTADEASKTGKIFSPHFPYHYESSTDCTYYLEGLPGEQVKLTFTVVDLPPQELGCDKYGDSIFIFDGRGHQNWMYSQKRPPRQRHSRSLFIASNNTFGPDEYSNQTTVSRVVRSGGWEGGDLIETLCGKMRGMSSPVLSTSNSLVVQFHSGPNHDLRGRGFAAEYHFYKELPAVDWNLPGQITTPSSLSKYPDLFAEGRPCNYTITSSDGTESGLIASPGFPSTSYPVDIKCQYTFRATGKQRVQLIFKRFDLYLPASLSSGNKYTCRGDYDHFTAYVELNGRWSEVKTFCGGETPPQLMSARTTLHAEFTSHSHPDQPSPTPRGFEFIYRFVRNFGIKTPGIPDPHKVCGFIFNSSLTASGSFTSPNYPGYYPRNTDCHYEFHAQENQYVRIFFTYFDIEGYEEGCLNITESDYILTSNFQTKDVKMKRFCGKRKPKTQESDGGYFRVMFHSNGLFDATGFYALYQFVNRTTHRGITKIRLTSSSCPLLLHTSLLLQFSFLVLQLFRFYFFDRL